MGCRWERERETEREGREREREAAGNPLPRAGCGWRLCWWKYSRSGFLPWMVCFPPPLTWQAVKCSSLWCVEALDCIHAHRSRQPLIHWMTSHKRDKPVRAVVRALQHVMNRLFCVALHILLFFFFFISVYYNHATGYLLLSAVSCAVCRQASIQKGGEAAEQTSQI